MKNIIDAHQKHKQYKTTFDIPDKEEVEGIEEGTMVKMAFVVPKGSEPVSAASHSFMASSGLPQVPEAERMWVEVVERNGDRFLGKLANDPAFIADMEFGDKVEFETKHILVVAR